MASDATPQGAPEKPVLPGLKPLHRIGFGSSGEVWSCRNEVDGSVSAVKIVRRTTQDQRTWYKHELKALKKFKEIRRRPDSLLSVEHVAKSADNSFLYYTMPMADSVGGFPQGSAKYRALTLGKRLKHEGRLDLRDSAKIAVRVAEALRALHANGLLHRDVKPDNILFIDGLAVLADIGLVTDDRPDASIAGTEKYMEPGKNPSKSTDLYALGKVLYRMANGLDPVDDFPECVSLNEGDDTALFRALNDICMRACGEDEERYSSADEMIADLRNALDAQPSPATPHIDEHAGRTGQGPAKAEAREDAGPLFPPPEQTLTALGYRLMRSLGSNGPRRVWMAEEPGGWFCMLTVVELMPDDPSALVPERDAATRMPELRRFCRFLPEISGVLFRPDLGFLSYAMPLPDDASGNEVLGPETYEPRTLESDVDRYGRLPVRECAGVFRNILQALGVLHANGITHGRPRPECVLFVDGQPVLYDIGIGCQPRVSPGISDGPASPPEKAQTPAGDLYLLSATLYYAATGHWATGIINAACQIQDPEFPKLLRVIRVAGDRIPLKRYVNARAMELALQRVIEADIVPAKPPAKRTFADFMRRAVPERRTKPEPPGMSAFKTRIKNIVDAAQDAANARQSSEHDTLTAQDFEDISRRILFEFERRIGYEPPSVKTACLLAEAAAETSDRQRNALYREAGKEYAEGNGVDAVIRNMGKALGWDKGTFEAVVKTIFFGQTVLTLGVVSIIANQLRGTGRLLTSGNDHRKRVQQALLALSDGISTALNELWETHGEQLSM